MRVVYQAEDTQLGRRAGPFLHNGAKILFGERKTSTKTSDDMTVQA